MIKKLEILPYNDVLNNEIAHFFKSGAVRRSKANDKLDKIHHLLPEKGNYGTNLEYDLWYDFKGESRIRGYIYTDVMTKFVYIRPASSKYSKEVLKESLSGEITEEGEKIFEDIRLNNSDKYKLKSTDTEHPYVIFLPGTNILRDIVDWNKVKKALTKGAKLKPHPLTSPFCMSELRAKYGKESLLDRKASGQDILNKSKVIGCCSNSEMGLIGIAQGKRIELFDNRHPQQLTYKAFYSALYENGYPVVDDLKRILSSNYSGLIFYLSKNPQNKIDNFFNYFKKVVHVQPKKSKSLNTRG